MGTKDKTFQKMFILKHSKFVSTLFIHFPQVIVYNEWQRKHYSIETDWF